MTTFRSISPQELHQLIQTGPSIDLVDVRTPAEYQTLHAAGARSIPLSALKPQAIRDSRPAGAAGSTYVICQSGGRSRQAYQRLVDAGLTDVVNVEGGTAAWHAAGLPVELASPCSPAGLPGWTRGLGLLLVLVCLVLALLVRPWFMFVGVGIWLLLLIAGRGACPLNSCAAPTAPPRDGS